nr:hypothetical protein [uncultured Capnocytophaga sp.]
MENIINEYPYFQAVRAVYLKILYAQESYRYNKELKITAAHIGNRTLLFDFITSQSFKEKKDFLKNEDLPKAYADEVIPSEFTTYVGEDVFEKKEFYPVETTGQKKLSVEQLKEEQTLHKGKPIDFEKSDQLSFAKWLEITRFKPIDRRTANITTNDLPFVEKNIFEEGDVRAKKFDLIDKFLESNPKIEVKKDYESDAINIAEKKDIGRQFMTETLARVYLEQEKYTEAIQAYQILMLKNPAKSVFFAEQIAMIRKLQQNKL